MGSKNQYVPFCFQRIIVRETFYFDNSSIKKLLNVGGKLHSTLIENTEELFLFLETWLKEGAVSVKYNDPTMAFDLAIKSFLVGMDGFAFLTEDVLPEANIYFENFSKNWQVLGRELEINA